MTEQEKMFFSEKLFDEIGLIDDRYIYEAETPYVPKRRFGIIGKILVIAAALSLTLCISIGTLLTGALFLFGGFGGKSDADKNDWTPEENSPTFDGSTEYSALSDRLENVSTLHTTVAKEDIDFFDGTPKVVWKLTDENEYRVLEISSSQASALIDKMSKDGGSKISSGDREDRENTSVWIILDSGQVITPHLAFTAGNVGYGELFDYQREYEPSKEFSDLLIDTVS